MRLDQIFDHPPLYFGRVDDVTNALLPVHAKAVLDGTVRFVEGKALGGPAPQACVHGA